MSDYPVYLIPLLPLAGAFFNLFLGRVLWRIVAGRDPSRGVVHFVAISVLIASFAVALGAVAGPLWKAFMAWHEAGGSGILADNQPDLLYSNLFTWIEVGQLKLNLAFRVDTLSAVMILVITFVGALIHIYSTGYMADEPRYAAYFGYLNLFTGAMLILVLGDNLPVMFIGWEGVGLCSYLLIGFWFENESYAYAGRKAFVVNRIGDFAFLLGMFLLFQAVGSLDFANLRSAEAMVEYRGELWGERLAFWAGLFLFIGACGKSAQIPLYVWLPDAMAGPTPVSALIHAATMVTAGVYMVARMSFLYASSTTAMAVVAGVGAATALFAAIMAFAQTDFKKVLAYSTVSQLGFMFVGVGVGAWATGVFHLVTHAFFKAGLFLAAGSVMHAMSGSGDITKMGGLRHHLKWTHGAFVVYWLAICGLFIGGFFSKDEILAAAVVADAQDWWVGWYGELLWVILTLAALGTAFYMTRLYLLAFWGECRADAETKAHIHESPVSMTGVLVTLAIGTVAVSILGLPHLHIHGWEGLLESWLEASTARPELGYESIAESLAPSEPMKPGGIALFMVIAVAVACAGIAAAWKLYGKGPSDTVAEKTASGFGAKLHKVVYNKFYIDEFYDAVIVRPFRWACGALWEVIDKFVIDLIFVTGAAFVVGLLARAARWLQNGRVHRYLAGFLVGAACVFYFTTEPVVDFTYEFEGDKVLLRADVGAGPSAKIKQGSNALRWDLNGNGSFDDPAEQAFRDQLEVVVPRDRIGDKVTVRYKESVFDTVGKRTKRIVFDTGVDPRSGDRPPPGNAPRGGQPETGKSGGGR